MINHFVLSDNDKAQPIWARLRAHAESELTRLRIMNDSEKLTEMETATLRGHIKCLKVLLHLGDDPPDMTGDQGAPRGAFFSRRTEY